MFDLREFMLGNEEETRQSGLVERIGFIKSEEDAAKHIILLKEGEHPFVLSGGWSRGEYERVIGVLAITVPGDEVVFTLKGDTLISFSNLTLERRLSS